MNPRLCDKRIQLHEDERQFKTLRLQSTRCKNSALRLRHFLNCEFEYCSWGESRGA